MKVNITLFDVAIKKIGNPPFEQSMGWLEFKSDSASDFLFFIDNDTNPTIACYGRVLKKIGIGNILDIQGEVKKADTPAKQITKFFSSIIEDSCCNMITYNSTSRYSCDFEIGLRRAGFTRPFGFRTCPLSILIDLQNKRNPDRMWRRNLKKAQEDELQFEAINIPNENDTAEFIQFFEELQEMKSLRYALNKDKIYALLKTDGYKLFFASKQGKRLCGRIIYIDSLSLNSYDVFAANSFDSRKHSATHFLMESIFEYLKEIGIKYFDFSRIPPSNNETDSVYLFKQSAGGDIIQYNGEWIWSKSRYLNLLFCVYNFFIVKSHNY